MLHHRVTTADDVINIQPNQYFNTTKDIVIQSLAYSQIKSWSILNNFKVVAIILAQEFCKDFYKIGIIICKDIKISELKYIKQVVKEVIELYNAQYVYSENETHIVKDKFHELMGFELERDLGIFKKWKYKGLRY